MLFRSGGYAGDALPAARLLAAASGCLITHPNVMNGASLYWSDPRIHYVEGSSLDRFAVGELALRPVRRQRIGLLLDAGIEPELLQRHLQVADGCRATLGLEIGPVVITDAPLEVTLSLGASGVSWGELGCPEALLRAGRQLQARDGEGLDVGVESFAIIGEADEAMGDGQVATNHRMEPIDILGAVLGAPFHAKDRGHARPAS